MNNKKIAKVCEAAENDYYSLTADERAVYNVKNIIDAVTGKGLLSFYENECGSYAVDTAEDLYSLGMDEVAFVVESANSLFPGGEPDEDLDARLEIIDSWDHDYDSLYDQWNEDIMEFLIPLEEAFEQLLERV